MTGSPERYPSADIAAARLETWDGDDLALLRYHPKRMTGGKFDVPSQLLLDFKGGYVEAANLMTGLVVDAITRQTEELRDKRRCRYVLALPSREAGRLGGPCLRLVANIAREFDWLQPLPALERHTTVPKSATAGPGERPTRDDHKESMRYSGPVLNIPGESVIMVDDVITAGETSAAGRAILLEATRCRTVVGLFLSRTTYT